MTLVEEFLAERKRGFFGNLENKIVDFANRTGKQQKVANLAHSIGYNRKNQDTLHSIGAIVTGGATLAAGQLIPHVTGHPSFVYGAGLVSSKLTNGVVKMAQGVHTQLQLQHKRNRAFDRAAVAAERDEDGSRPRAADHYEDESNEYHRQLLRHRGEI